ncbi:hypothetical protein CC1G_08737 [Coprinopsis cinerea okayama7|uniref:Integrase zinc-binding domain-containing protein n=1 Tax=Coprinopsis cinerea (strain Okayama-7 / 130 / ATCC MYA-4618 / FGSC 9003) TaxID=240176 RepID=A8NIZ2_COPC7|nr:hypothetical protein CC1G_08737 [Coprinopsis cinerea okayama7\|eukprot:XP_001834106.2 hypothetical protein CC1G_08737 [Coprinopsis cinerea okayama7\
MPASSRTSPNRDASRVSVDTVAVQPLERPGFPTYAQYKQIETNYIESLTPRRQGKALISQAMFDRIWDVLHHPESQIETAQFRFWARKMFTVNKEYRITLGVPEGIQSPAQEVLLHDNLLVAIQEQLYDLLCYCHGSTGHGGRDKTCALIRKHYTWVPKDLVSNFIKACPTCIMKKCGNVDVNSSIPQLIAETDRMSARLINQEVVVESGRDVMDPSSFSARLSSHVSYQDTSTHSTSPSLSWTSGEQKQQKHHHTPTMRQSMSHGSSDSSPSGFSSVHSGPLNTPDDNSYPTQLHSMVREVSLYRGLPNGWQYRHDDFETAHTEFMEYKKQWDHTPLHDPADYSDPLRPRIPSIAGMWTPDHFRTSVKEEEDDLDLIYPGHSTVDSHYHQQQVVLPPMSRALGMSGMSGSLAPILLGSPRLGDGYVGEIDPALLALPGTGPLSIMDAPNLHPHGGLGLLHRDEADTKAAYEHLDPHDGADPFTSHSLSASNSFKRANAPPALDLSGINEEAPRALPATSQTHMDADAGGYESHGEGGWANVVPSDPSPTSSEVSSGSSGSSGLSPFPVPTSAKETPLTSATASPVSDDGASDMKNIDAAYLKERAHEAALLKGVQDAVDHGELQEVETQVEDDDLLRHVGYAF